MNKNSSYVKKKKFILYVENLIVELYVENIISLYEKIINFPNASLIMM